MLVNTQNMAATKHRKTSILLWIPLLASLLMLSKAEIFSKEPKSQLIPQGSAADIIFPCRAGNELTNPTYTWMKDNHILGIAGRYNLYTGELHISAPEDSDAGNYICVIDSEEGRVASNTAELTFSYLKQSTTPVSATITRPQSTGVTMPCGEMNYSPEFSIYFMWDNTGTWTRTPWQGTKTHFVSQKTGNMYLANPQPSDSGSYRCTGTSIKAINNVQPKADGNTVSLTIEASTANYAPVFMVIPDEITYARLNGKTFIECFASGNPTPNITWTKDGKELPKTAQLSPSGQLYYVDITEAAEGTYTCTASNGQGSVTASGKLVLRYPPIWNQEISSASYDLASTVSWTCAAKAIPAATYAWWKNGQPINQSDSSVSITDPTGENGYSSMMVKDLKEENAGIYQCVATNNLGNIVSSANLVVNSYPPVIEPEVLSVTYAALGEEATIFCTHTAAPAADVTWTKNEFDIIQESAKHSIISDASLIIHDVTADDEGEYTCTLNNILGSDGSTGHLKAYQQTVITEAPEDVSIMAGKSVSLTCAASKDEALPLTWNWHHDDELLNGIFHDHYSLNGGTLNINSATNGQSGEYKCCAITSVSKPCATANVHVIDRPDAPAGVSVESTTQNSHELLWIEPFDNYSPITGYSIEYKNSYNTDWQQAETDPAVVESTICTVLNLLPFNDYTYRVYATNEYGTSDASNYSPVESTTKGAPPKAPGSVEGGGGEEGQLVVTWEPLTVEFYGSVSVDYVVAVQKRTEALGNNGIDLPSILEPNNNTTLVEDALEEEEWITQTVTDPKKGYYIFKVDPSEIYAPYNVRVRAVNDRGDGPWSLTRIVHTFENAPDTAPVGIGVGTTTPEAYLVHLEWDILVETTGRIAGYVVEVTQKAGPNMETKIERTSNAVPFITVKGLTANIVYQARVAGFNGAGQGPWSKPFIFNTSKKPPSQPPTDVRVSIKNTVVTAEWKPIVYEDGQGMDEALLRGYKIQYRAVNSTDPMTETTTNTHHTFTVKNNSRYNLQVRGYSDGGDGVASRSFYLSTESTAAPGYIHCCGANAVKFNSAIIMVMTLLWMLFVKLDL